jgi:hypothetical protein
MFTPETGNSLPPTQFEGIILQSITWLLNRQVMCMGEWKKSSDDELINNLRRGLLMVSMSLFGFCESWCLLLWLTLFDFLQGIQVSLELEDHFWADKEHLAHANNLAALY